MRAGRAVRYAAVIMHTRVITQETRNQLKHPFVSQPVASPAAESENVKAVS